ncbi:MAG: ABC transporter permease [Ardenticatenaceae bacterium]|nr:ABC transporter permease [Ardenticatenaceae bacterium]HBY95154.1 peptide ABC transporter permease [Chloroflexota bacterium]
MSLRYITFRLLQALLLLVLATLVVFLLLRLVPADPALLLLGGHGTQADVQAIREALGLNRPLYVQYIDYMARLLHGDLGSSLASKEPVADMIRSHLPATILLALGATALGVPLGVGIGFLSALKRYSWIDTIALFVALMAQSMPIYWLGLMLILFFAVRLHALPAVGYGTLPHLILPSITLSTYILGLLIRVTRSSLLEILNEDYIRTARGKGLRERTVIVRHAFPNVLIPIITILGLQIGTLLSGAVITEAVFAWPGLGTLAVVALAKRDYPVVQGVVLVTAAMFVLINFCVDLCYGYLDPRIRRA